MEGGCAPLLRAGQAARGERASVGQGPLRCGFHRILVSGTLQANFSGLLPALGHEDGIHLLRKDFAFQRLVTTLTPAKRLLSLGLQASPVMGWALPLGQPCCLWSALT